MKQITRLEAVKIVRWSMPYKCKNEALTETVSGKHYLTQALTENWIVCWSQRIELGVAPDVAEGPDVRGTDPEAQSLSHRINRKVVTIPKKKTRENRKFTWVPGTRLFICISRCRCSRWSGRRWSRHRLHYKIRILQKRPWQYISIQIQQQVETNTFEIFTGKIKEEEQI